MVHMAEELGELAREVNKQGGYKPGVFKTSSVSHELVDLLYLVIKLANKYNIDLSEEWATVEQLYAEKEKRA